MHVALKLKTTVMRHRQPLLQIIQGAAAAAKGSAKVNGL